MKPVCSQSSKADGAEMGDINPLNHPDDWHAPDHSWLPGGERIDLLEQEISETYFSVSPDGEIIIEPSELDIVDEYFDNNMAPRLRKWSKSHMTTYHIKFEFDPANNSDLVDFMHSMIYDIDQDYPFNPFARKGDKISVCTKCKGIEWKNSQLGPEEIKKAAKQLGVEVSIRGFRKESKCKGAALKEVPAI